VPTRRQSGAASVSFAIDYASDGVLRAYCYAFTLGFGVGQVLWPQSQRLQVIRPLELGIRWTQVGFIFGWRAFDESWDRWTDGWVLHGLVKGDHQIARHLWPVHLLNPILLEVSHRLDSERRYGKCPALTNQVTVHTNVCVLRLLSLLFCQRPAHD